MYKTKKPEIEAEIYYLTAAENGRKNPVWNGYRGQFYYDERDWDASQEFLNKESCTPGETVRVILRTLSPDFHVGKFWVGKEFEIREGSRTVGRGKILKIIREEFIYWNYQEVIENLPKNCIPYNTENIDGFVFDFKYYLENLKEIKSVECEINLSNQEEMIIVKCELENTINRLRPLFEGICKTWRKEISFKNAKFKTNINENLIELSFITWHSMYLTGKIIVEIK